MVSGRPLKTYSASTRSTVPEAPRASRTRSELTDSTLDQLTCPVLLKIAEAFEYTNQAAQLQSEGSKEAELAGESVALSEYRNDFAWTTEHVILRQIILICGKDTSEKGSLSPETIQAYGRVTYLKDRKYLVLTFLVSGSFVSTTS